MKHRMNRMNFNYRILQKLLFGFPSLVPHTEISEMHAEMIELTKTTFLRLGLLYDVEM